VAKEDEREQLPEPWESFHKGWQQGGEEALQAYREGRIPQPDFRELEQRVEEVLATLTQEESDVLRQYHGLADGRSRTLEEIAEAKGITPQEAKTIQQRAFQKLKADEQK